MLRQIRVYDLDGVLVDSSHRYRNKPDGSIDLDYWLEKATPENIARDKLLPLAKQYINDAQCDDVYTVICSARVICSATLAFIIGNLGKPNKLILREPGNLEHDAKLKRRELTRLFNLRQFRHLPAFFWDDNIKNLAATSHLFTKVFHIHSEICEND